MTLPKLAVIGLGRLGAPMATVFSASGYNVIGADIDTDAVDAINKGEPPPRVNEPGLAELIDAHRPAATTDVRQAAADSDIAFIVVPTPSGADDRFDASMVHAAVTDVARGFQRRAEGMPDEWHPVIVVTSTVQPGECERLIHEVHCVTGWHEGDEYSLIYSPAFIALGSVVHDLCNADVTYLGCSNDRGAGIVGGIFARVAPNAMPMPMPVVDAEVAKLSLNVALTIKIGFANTVARVCESVPGADAANILIAVGADSRIGSKYLRVGGPPGGNCFPRDLRAFETLARDVTGVLSLAEAAQGAAADVTEWVVRQVEIAHIERTPKGEPARIGILGLSFKENIGIETESLGWSVAEALVHIGYQVYVDDPHVTVIPPGCHALGMLETLELPVLVLACAHDEYVDLPAVQGQTVIDCWSVCRDDGSGQLVRPGIG